MQLPSYWTWLDNALENIGTRNGVRLVSPPVGKYLPLAQTRIVAPAFFVDFGVTFQVEYGYVRNCRAASSLLFLCGR